MNHRNAVPALAIQFSVGAIFCTLYYMLVLHTEQRPGLYFPQVWMVYGPLIYGVNRLLLRKERTALVLFWVNLFLCAALYASILAEKGWTGFLGAGCTVFVCGMITARGVQLAMNAPSLSHVMLYLDASAAVLLLFFVYLMATGVSLAWAVPIMLSFAATILGVISVRIDRPMGPKEWSVVAVAFGTISLLVWLFVSVVAAPAGQGLVALWNALLTFGQFLLRLLWAVLLFLSSLFGEPEYGELEPPVQFEIPAMEEIAEEANPAMLVILLVLAAVFLLYLAVLGLRLLGRLRVGGKQKTVMEKTPRRKVSLWMAIKRLLAGLRKNFHLRLYLYRNRNKPAGVFYYLVRRCRRSPWRKRTGETPGMFLRRMRDSAGEDGELRAALNELIPAVDAALYAPDRPAQPFPQASLIRRRIGTAVRRHFARQVLTGLRSVVYREREKENARRA